jgi:flagellar motor switch protein FliM
VDDVLEQDEVDALLMGLGGLSTEDTSLEDDDPTGIKAYDFTNQERIIRGRLPALDIINERFARGFQKSLNEMLITNIEVSPGEVRIVKMSDYQRNLLVPTSLNIFKINPLNGVSLFTLDSKLIFTVIDMYYGGTGEMQFRIEGRDYTSVEMSMVKTLLGFVDTHLIEAWSPVMAIETEFMNSEMNPRFATIVDPAEMVVVSTIQARLEGKDGKVDIVIPYTLLEPYRVKLEEGVQNLHGESDKRWIKTIKDESQNVVIDLKAELAEIPTTWSDLYHAKPGDVLPFDMPESVVVTSGGIPLFSGEHGESNGMNAVKVDKLYEHPAYNLKQTETVESFFNTNSIKE